MLSRQAIQLGVRLIDVWVNGAQTGTRQPHDSTRSGKRSSWIRRNCHRTDSSVPAIRKSDDLIVWRVLNDVERYVSKVSFVSYAIATADDRLSIPFDVVRKGDFGREFFHDGAHSLPPGLSGAIRTLPFAMRSNSLVPPPLK